MEEPVHFIILLLLNQEGLIVKEVLEFTRGMTLFECLGFGDQHREAISTYFEDMEAMVDLCGSTYLSS